jgi:hypothetical protein
LPAVFKNQKVIMKFGIFIKPLIKNDLGFFVVYRVRTVAGSYRSQGDSFSGQCGDCLAFEWGVVACKTPRIGAGSLTGRDI